MEMSSLYLEKAQYEDREDRPLWKTTYKVEKRKLRLQMGPRRGSGGRARDCRYRNRGRRYAGGAGREKTDGLTQRMYRAQGGQGEPGGGSQEQEVGVGLTSHSGEEQGIAAHSTRRQELMTRGPEGADRAVRA